VPRIDLEEAAAPAAVPRPSPVLRASGAVLALAFRLLPRTKRFRAARNVARCLEPLIARTAAYEERSRLGTDDLRETSLELVLMMLTRHGATFDPIMRIDGDVPLRRSGNCPTLIVAQHTMLSVLFLRHLEDAGHAPFVIAADPHLRIPGTMRPARVLCPSPALLFRVRRLLSDGRTIAAMIDRHAPERRGSRFETARGPLFLSDALLRLGLRTRAHIVFLATAIDDQARVVCRLSAPSIQSDNVEDVLADFVRFTDEGGQPGAAERSTPRFA
jgi:hypothetical protein